MRVRIRIEALPFRHVRGRVWRALVEMIVLAALIPLALWKRWRP